MLDLSDTGRLTENANRHPRNPDVLTVEAARLTALVSQGSKAQIMIHCRGRDLGLWVEPPPRVGGYVDRAESDQAAVFRAAAVSA